MNYYQRHLGDFARDTAHLSALEFGVYNLLLDWYYANERPIPDAQAHRYGRCERETVAMILSEFFTKDGDHWMHKRVEAEIAAYNAKAAKNREVGKMGGRPKPNGNHDGLFQKPNGNHDGYQTVSERLANGSKNETETNPSHKPLASSQETERACVTSDDVLPAKPKREQIGTRLPDDWQPDASLTEWAATERPDLNLAREIAGFRDYWHSRAGKDARKASWPLTFRNWIRNSRNGSKPQTQIGGSRAAGRLL